jgi:hypothetical protein
MIYNFVIVEGVDPNPPADTPQITQPLWSLPVVGARTDRGALSQGLYNDLATHFILTTNHEILHLVVFNREGQAPHLIKMMEFDRPKAATSAIGFEKAFIQHERQTASRLSFSWDFREAESTDTQAPCSCVCAISQDYPTTSDGARLPKFDEETGRIIQDSLDGVWVVDTALYR